MAIELTAIAAAAPCITGALLGAILALSRYTGVPGIVALFGGAGGLFGYLTLAFFVSWWDSSGSRVFSETLISILLLSVLLSILFFTLTVARLRSYFFCLDLECTAPRSSNQLPISLIFGVIIIVLVSQTIIQAAITPVVSWDALGLWVGWADFFLEFDQDALGNFQHASEARPDGGSFPLQHSRHPHTVIHLAAFAGFALGETEVFRGWLVPWTCVWLCAAAAVWGFMRACCDDQWIPSLVLVGYFSLPLMTNHAILLGYADFWVATSVIIAVALLSMFLVWGGLAICVFGILFAFIPLALKNTGLMYVAVVILPFISIFAVASYPRLCFVGLGSIVIAAAFAYYFGFDIQVAGKRIALVRGDVATAFAGGWQMPFKPYPMIDIVKNQLWAFLINQSFSTVALMLLAVIGSAFAQKNKQLHVSPYGRALVYLLAVVVSLLIVFSLPQLALQFSESYAAPSSDTGLSRFLLAAGPLVIMAAALFARILETGEGCSIANRGSPCGRQ